MKTPEVLALAALEGEKQRRLTENKLAYFQPYPKQREFLAAGAKFRERLLLAANQVGKTYAGAMEVAIHATGRYEWWTGYRFDHPVRVWVCGESSEVVRETIQRLLLGEPGYSGRGTIPKDALLEVVPARGTPELVDTIRVRHASGGSSTIGLKSYSQGRERFQGATLDFAWCDEEPPSDVFHEILTRLNVTGGPLIMTFTPLMGMSEVVRRFLLEKSPHRTVIKMTLDDAEHYSDKQRSEIIAQYPEHMKDIRAKGIPSFGAGLIFPIDEKRLLVEPFKCPTHWPKIGGLDFGWTHKFAACELWHDRDLDIVYLVKTWAVREQTPLEHAQALRSWKLQFAWPADGRSQTLAGAGIPLMKQYADAGLDMMYEHAQFEDGSTSVEAGVMQMLDRMRGGRWKVFKGDNDAWLDEVRTYHRDAKTGLIVKEADDAISASRYALMSLRHARTDAAKADFNRELVYPNVGRF
jgi:phage terminase large subunit-like protein